MSPASICRCIAVWILGRRSDERPTSSGLAFVDAAPSGKARSAKNRETAATDFIMRRVLCRMECASSGVHELEWYVDVARNLTPGFAAARVGIAVPAP